VLGILNWEEEKVLDTLDFELKLLVPVVASRQTMTMSMYYLRYRTIFNNG